MARRALIGALLVGLAAVLLCASISAPIVGASQPVRNWVAGYLDDGHQFGQIIQPSAHDLVGVRLWLLRPVAPGAGTILLSVRALDGGDTLATARLAVADLPAHGPATFRFDPVALDRVVTSKPAPVALVLTTQGVERSSAVSVMAGPNGYSNGIMLRDGRENARADLAFELLYRSSWFDRALSITQIARSRPGIFGWPPLYALLVYAMLVALGLFLRRLALVLAPEVRGQGSGIRGQETR